MKRLLFALAALFATSTIVQAQTATILANTVLQADIGAQTRQVQLAHAASMSVGQTVFFFDDQSEGSFVEAINGINVTLTRGYGTPAFSHKAGTLVYYGASSSFITTDQTAGASCTTATVYPSISLRSRVLYACSAGIWTVIAGPPAGAAGTELLPLGSATLIHTTPELWASSGSAADIRVSRVSAGTLNIDQGTTGTNGAIAGGAALLLAGNGAIGGVYNWQITSAGHLLAAADATYDIGANDATRPRSLYVSSPSITKATGTGITLNDSGELRTVIYKITVAASQFITAGVTHDVTIATLPAKTFIAHVLADITQVFACASTCTTSTLSMTLGTAAGGNQLLVSFDADAALGQFGDAAAELGASLTEASIPTTIGSLGSWSATTPVSLRLTSGTGNIGTGAATNLSTGSVTFYITTTVMP